MIKRKEDYETLKDLTSITTLNGEDILEIVMSDRTDDYVEMWRARISEEIQTRISTGVITPISTLTWCIRGIGWETLQDPYPFKEHWYGKETT